MQLAAENDADRMAELFRQIELGARQADERSWRPHKPFMASGLGTSITDRAQSKLIQLAGNNDHTSIAAAKSSMALPTDLNSVICAADVRPFAVPRQRSNRSPRIAAFVMMPRLSGTTISPASLPAPARVST